MSRRAEVLWVVLILPIAFRVGLAPLFAPDATLAAHEDQVHLLAPIMSEMARAFQQWEFPYWMPSVLAGLPLHTDPDMSAAYPFYFLIFDIFRTPLEAMRSIHAITLFHLLVLQINSYVLMRCLRARPIAAATFACIVAFSPNSVSYAEWINIAASYAWLPLVIGATVLILERRTEARPVLFGTAGFAMLVLASPAQGIIHAIYIIAALLLARMSVWITRREFPAMRGALVDLTIMAAGTIAASAPALLPPLLNLDNMIRFAGTRPPSVGQASVPFEATLEGQLSPADWPSMLVPFHVPTIVGNWFVGLPTAFFALVGLVHARRSWIVGPLGLLAVWAVGSAMGSHLGFAQVNYHLPFLDMFREPPRHMVVFVIAAASLAAIGFDALAVEFTGWRPAVSWRPLVVSVGFALLAIAAVSAPLQYSGLGPRWLTLLLFGAVLALAAASVGRRGRARAALLAAAGVLIVVSTYLKPTPPSAKLQASRLFRPSNLASHRALEQLGSVIDRRYRVHFESGGDERPSAWAMNGSFHGLRAFSAFKNPIADARQFDEIFFRPEPSRYYPILAGKYYLCRRCDQIDPAMFRLDRSIDEFKLYVADSAVPPVTVVTRVAGLYQTPEDFLARIGSGVNFRNEAYLHADVSFPTLPELMAGNPAKTRAEVREESRTFNSVVVTVGTDHDAIVLLNEYYNDAWTATVNGRRVRPFRVNLNQVGVAVETGGSVVRFEYRPALTVWLLRLEAALGSTLVGWLLWRGWLIARTWRGNGARFGASRTAS